MSSTCIRYRNKNDYLHIYETTALSEHQHLKIIRFLNHLGNVLTIYSKKHSSCTLQNNDSTFMALSTCKRIHSAGKHYKILLKES